MLVSLPTLDKSPRPKSLKSSSGFPGLRPSTTWLSGAPIIHLPCHNDRASRNDRRSSTMVDDQIPRQIVHIVPKPETVASHQLIRWPLPVGGGARVPLVVAAVGSGRLEATV